MQNQMTSLRVLLFAGVLLIFLILDIQFCAHVAAQDKKRPIEGIADNIFLVEEAYNQEPGVVQHVLTAEYGNDKDGRGWAMSFTQEWPVFSQDHQFSYTIPFSFIHEGGKRQDGIEDLLLNYRYQALEESELSPAFSPRFSLVVPTGSRDRGKGSGVVGYEFQLPFSKTVGDRVAFHLNGGVNYLPHARARLESGRLSPKRSLVSYHLGASTIYALNSFVHLMLEWLGEFEEDIGENGRAKNLFQSTLSPGVRAAVSNGPDHQAVLGIAAPIGTNRQAQDYGIFLYFSFEHKFLHP
jgi:hypothetical protein